MADKFRHCAHGRKTVFSAVSGWVCFQNRPRFAPFVGNQLHSKVLLAGPMSKCGFFMNRRFLIERGAA